MNCVIAKYEYLNLVGTRRVSDMASQQSVLAIAYDFGSVFALPLAHPSCFVSDRLPEQS